MINSQMPSIPIKEAFLSKSIDSYKYKENKLSLKSDLINLMDYAPNSYSGDNALQNGKEVDYLKKNKAKKVPVEVISGRLNNRTLRKRSL